MLLISGPLDNVYAHENKFGAIKIWHILPSVYQPALMAINIIKQLKMYGYLPIMHAKSSGTS